MMARVLARENKLDQRVRVLTVGFVGLLIIMVGFMCLSLLKPATGATTPGTCLPIDKGGTGCDYTAFKSAMGMGDIVNKNILDLYPVGSIFISTTLTNPGSYLGGTWVSFGAGRTLMGMGSNGTNNYTTPEATGGSDSVALVTANLASHAHTSAGHTHSFTGTALGTHNHTQNAHNHGGALWRDGSSTDYIGVDGGPDWGSGIYVPQHLGKWPGSITIRSEAATNIAASAGTPAGTVGSTTPGDTGSVGSGTAHENRTSFITVYFWKRTV